MSWVVNYSNQADKFLQKNPSQKERLLKSISDFIKKISGTLVSIDVKSMKGVWQGCYRIRKGDSRIILSIDEIEQTIHIHLIDYRGDVYK